MKLWFVALAFLLGAAWAYYWVFYMPGRSYHGPSSPLDTAGRALREALTKHVQVLAHGIGPRHAGVPHTLDRTAVYIETSLRKAGHTPQSQQFEALGQAFRNIEVELPGTSIADEIVVIGAHYDTVADSPGANDNGSGVAALLELARLSRDRRYHRTVRFVAFVNEEHPYAETAAMGSLVYAQRAQARDEKIVGMIALETIGYFSDAAGSQRYPPPLNWFYPDTGNFLAFVGDLRSRAWVTRTIFAFRAQGHIASEGVAAPRWIKDIARSDHAPFWDAGYPALMVTDTAPFRYPYYHNPGDTADKLDYHRLAQVVRGLHAMLEVIASR